MTLDEYALEYGTDKASSHHNYTEIYERVFSPVRETTKGLIEIGIGGVNYKGVAGSSLKMWASYFTNAQVVGVDIDPTAEKDYGERISVVIGDQTRKSVLDKALNALPSVDVIIDDGSHINNLTVATFEYLWPRLRPGGIYVIEDTVCVGELRLGNTRAQTEQLVLTLLRGLEVNGRIMTKGNAADFYKINPDYCLNDYERWVESVELYRGVYVIRKRPR
ncbi:class I SAM-dependent methyltransferase [Rhizobium mongolense]|uniref:class I SAM-dependent methyltransferase n=1 Tax=Rhizobium mongolense TaxID=57676 RepID=UPI0034A5744B